jgi:DUF1009 family protein
VHVVGTSQSTKLGIIAGGGALPGLLASACASSGRPYYILALTGFADTAFLPREPDSWMRLGEVGKGFGALRNAAVHDVVMAGSVKRPSFSDLKTDLKGASMLARIAGKALGDDSLLTAVIGEIEQEGFKVVGVDSILAELLAPEGPVGAFVPDESARTDIALGMARARDLGREDIGQAVVVRQGVVLGLEDSEGTDALLARCASVQSEGQGGVLVKAKKPQQERRADLPAIGPETVRNAHAAGLLGIAVEAGHTLVIDRPGVAAAADELGLFVFGLA